MTLSTITAIWRCELICAPLAAHPRRGSRPLRPLHLEGILGEDRARAPTTPSGGHPRRGSRSLQALPPEDILGEDRARSARLRPRLHAGAPPGSARV